MFVPALLLAFASLLAVACGDASAPTPEPATQTSGSAASTPEPAAALPVATLASGMPGGTYLDRYAAEIDERVTSWDIEPRVTAGSTENLDLLAEGKVDLALAQADVFASRIAEEPAVFGNLKLVALLAEECVFVAFRKGGPVDEFDDLAHDIGDGAAIISIGPADGGMAETWNHLSSVLSEQSNADVDYSDGEAGLEKLVRGEVDAVAWITDPRNADHVLLKTVRADPDLGLLDIEDERLFDVLAGETDVYLPRTLPVREAEGESVDTICTPALLMARSDAPQALLDALKEAGFGRI
jgi:TRAP-type uncharacterized transport system substrate-binding protein